MVVIDRILWVDRWIYEWLTNTIEGDVMPDTRGFFYCRRRRVVIMNVMEFYNYVVQPFKLIIWSVRQQFREFIPQCED